MEITYSLLTLKPRTELANGILTIETPLLKKLLGLGLFHRKVVVDPSLKTFSINTRHPFGRKTQTIPFAAVSRLDYTYDDTAWNTDSPWFGSQDSVEWFTISLVLAYDRETVHLCRFTGEGSIDHGWQGWLAGDDLIDYRGDQQESSLSLVKLLQEMTGLPLT